MKNSKSLIIPSELEQIKTVERFIEQLESEWNLDEDTFGNAMIAVTEAVNNALKHGNNYDPDKNITIKAVLTDNILEFTVADEGEGFDPEQLPNPLKEDNLLKDSGRGVFILRQLADKVRFNKRGNTVTVTFQR